MSTTTPRPLILISTGRDGDVGSGGKSNRGILESPPDSNGGFFSAIQLDLKTSTSKVSSGSIGKEVIETTKGVSSAMSNTPSGSNSSENSNDDVVYCICRRRTSDDDDN